MDVRHSQRDTARSRPPGRAGLWLLAIAGVAVCTLLVRPGQRASGWQTAFEAEDSARIGPPIEVRRDDSGTSFVHVPDNREASMEQRTLLNTLRYSFRTPVRQETSVWARTRWSNVCSNSFYFQIDDGPLSMIGNDEVFGRWQWVRHERSIVLGAGDHTLVITAAEPGIDIDRLVLSDTPSPALPSGEQPGFADDFGSGVPESWRSRTAGCERAVRDGRERGLRFLADEDREMQYAIRSGLPLAGDLYLRARFGRGREKEAGGSLALVFDRRANGKFRYVDVGADGIRLGRVLDAVVREERIAPVSSRLRDAIAKRESSTLELLAAQREIRVWLDGQLLGRAPMTDALDGEVGAGSRGGGVDLEAFEARPAAPPVLSHRFYVDSGSLERLGGCRIVSGSWRRGDVYASPSTYPLEARAGDGRAILAMGEKWWTRYRISAAVRPRPGVWAGLVLSYRDPDNYLLVRGRPGSPGQLDGELQIVRRRDGLEEVLGEVAADLPSDRWRILGAEVKEDGVLAWIEGGPSIASSRIEAAPGEVGLAVELAGREQPDPGRTPVLFLDKEEASSFSFHVPLQLVREDPGAVMLFHHRDAANYYGYVIDRRQEAGAARLRLVSVRDGRVEELWTAPLGMPAAEGGEPEQEPVYQLGVSVANGTIQLFLDGRTVGEVPEQDRRTGSIGVLGLMPASHADFDDVEVTAAESAVAGNTTHYEYSFTPTLRAARDLAAWDTPRGEWGIGLSTTNRFLYRLLGRTDADGSAALRSSRPYPGPIGRVRFLLQPAEFVESRLEIAISPARSTPSRLPLSVSLELARPPGDSGVVPHVTLRAGGDVLVPRTAAIPWLEPKWHEIVVTFRDARTVTLTVDGQEFGEASSPTPVGGDVVSLSFFGPQRAVLGVGGIVVDTAP